MAGEGRALLVLCGLCACAAGPAGAGADYCRQLEELRLESGAGASIPARALSESGSPRVLALNARGAAPEAARALLHALLRHALRYREQDLVHVNYTIDDLQAVDKHTHTSEFILSMSTEWSGEPARHAQCLVGACDVAGVRLSVLGPGAAPACRVLLARAAPHAPASCRDHWHRLLAPDCGFLANTTLHNTTALCSEWSNSTCPDGNACVVVVVDPGDDEQCRLARELAAELPVRLAPSTELRGNRSLLFFDYMWSDRSDHAWLAPPRPCHGAGDVCHPSREPVSLALADVHKLTRYAPPVLNLALGFHPPAALVRRVLANSTALGLQEAACEALVDNTTRKRAREWITCDDKFCDQKPTIRIYVCEEALEYYLKVANIVYKHWFSTTNRSSGLASWLFRTACSKPDEVSWNLNVAMSGYEAYARLRGVVAMGAAAASQLPEKAALARVPLLLAAAPARGSALPAGARSSAPGVPALTAAVRALLQHCGWRRVALLREEGSCDIWKRSLGVADALGEDKSLVMHTELVGADNASAALGALRARDARIVLLDASAGTAAQVLRAAEQDPNRSDGTVWIVVGQASSENDSSQDWLPTSPEFSYVTVGAWRGSGSGGGGGSGGGSGDTCAGSERLRGALDAALGSTWRPHAAPLADALLMMFEGVARLHATHPHLRDDPHQPNAQQMFYEELDNVTLEGVTHDIRANESIPVFAYRWTVRGPQLVCAWGARGPAPVPAGLCGAADGPACHTTRSGHAFTPHCHDVAWAVLLCALALGLPALGAARAARRRRLRRRDRAVEERALLRGGHSAAEAAAGAALAEHAVPRATLQLLDELGAGHYGVVHQAVLRRPAAAALAVAAKAPRADAPAGAAAELLREAALLAALRHEHIVRFAGVCWEGGPLVLMEHAFHGDLRCYLRARRTLAERARAGLPEPEAAHVAAPALTRLAREAAAALGYLAACRLVHRDVRAANCLVDSRRRLKLADFGMARWLDGGAGEGEYLCRRRAMFPVLWMAPESLARGVFSAASDVWALGVLLLELATLGERPFGAWRAARIVQHVRAGGAPALPSDAAPSTRGVTASCWRFAAEERPSAAELVAYLAEHPRAVQPALEPHVNADADCGPAAADTDLYIDEWTDDDI